jgi:O-antigen ligase
MTNNSRLDQISKYSLLVFAFSIPWSSALYRMSILSLCICFAAFVCLAISKKFIKDSEVEYLNLEPRIEWIWPLLLTAWVCLSWFWTSGSNELYRFDAWRYVKLTMIPVIGFFIQRLFRGNELQVIKAFCFGIIILMIPTYLDFLGLFNLLGLTGYIKGDAAYKHDSALGMNLVYWHNQIVHGFHVAMLFAISILTRPKEGKTKYLHDALALLCAFDVIFLIVGKMALFSLLASAFVVLIFTEQAKGRLKFLLFGALASVVLFISIDAVQLRALTPWYEMMNYFHNNQIDTSIGNRLHYWQISLDLFSNHPIIGNGAGSFRQWLISHTDPLVENHHYHTHNEYLTQLSQFGLIGLGLFSVMFYFVIKSAFNNPNKVVKHCILVVLVIFLINAMSDSSLHNEWEGWTLVLFSGIAISHLMRFKSVD